MLVDFRLQPIRCTKESLRISNRHLIPRIKCSNLKHASKVWRTDKLQPHVNGFNIVFSHLNLQIQNGIFIKDSCMNDLKHFEHRFAIECQKVYLLVILEDVKLNIVDELVNFFLGFARFFSSSCFWVASINIKWETFTCHSCLVILHLECYWRICLLEINAYHGEAIPILEQLFVGFRSTKITFFTLPGRILSFL